MTDVRQERLVAALLAAFLILCVQQEFRALLQLGFSSEAIRRILAGFIIPVFALHLAFYRSRKKSGSRKPDSK